MSRKLFVRNLPFSLSEEDLQAMFSTVGAVSSVKMPLDRETGRKRGIAFVEMENVEDAQSAIDKLHDYSVYGRRIGVELAKPREMRAA